MPRNHVICFDGTSNQFGARNTNVIRLAQILDRDPKKQSLHYVPGVGTLPEPGVITRLGKGISELAGLAFGAGLTRKVEQGYRYLMDCWEPGDQVFLFGFSRGAYTARVLAGLLHSLGLLPPGSHEFVPYVTRLFKSVRRSTADGSGGASQYWRLCNEFRWTFARWIPGGDDERRFRVHFLGLWDTVSSVGWVWDPKNFPFTARNPSVQIIRHVVAIDERRAFFRQNLMEQAGDQDLQELWFAGSHCDVGGGYLDDPENGGLWRVSFDWMLKEAEKAGLLVDEARLERVLNRSKPPALPWADPVHESLTPLWWIAEFFPKLVARPGTFRRWPRLGLGRRRFIRGSARFHESVLLRIRERAYSPPNISPDILKSVHGSLSESCGMLPEELEETRRGHTPVDI